MRDLRWIFGGLLLGGCGPSVESTSETLDTGEGDAASDTEACNGETPPELLAYFDAFARTEQTLYAIGDDVDQVQRELAVLLGLPSDAPIEAVTAAISAVYAQNLGPGSALVLGPVRCSGGIDAARENLALCQPELAVDGVTFACEGECTVADAVECPSPVCRGDQTTCTGTCTGTCALAVASGCDGTCMGDCEGACDCLADDGSCAGRCDGQCSGACEAIDGSCSAACEGSCDAPGVAECPGTWTCATPGFACTIDCTGIVVPNAVASQRCVDFASAAGSAAMACDPPFVSLQYAAIACSDFAETATALEAAIARLEHDRTRLADFTPRFRDVFNSYFDASLTPGDLDLSECVVQLVLDNVDRAATLTNGVAASSQKANQLLSALTPT